MMRNCVNWFDSVLLALSSAAAEALVEDWAEQRGGMRSEIDE